MTQKIQKIQQFLLEDLWRYTSQEKEALSPFQQKMYKTLRCLVLAVKRFFLDNMLSRAAALTYTTLLALVPILAIVFAIARGFGFSKMVENLVRENFQGHDEVMDMLFTAIDSYLEHTQSGIFLGIGFIFLAYTVVSLTSTIENTFNEIWQKSDRNPLRMLSYFSVLLLVPMAWVIISGLTIFLTTLADFLPDYLLLSYTFRMFIRLLPFLFIGLSFTGLYVFIPNTPVKLSCAIIPGFLAGAAFVGVQYFYINSQIWISNYNAIYGSFAALPMFLIWAQTSWSICLFGAELTYASQNEDAYSFDFDVEHASRRHQDLVALIILRAICKRFEQQGAIPYTAVELSKELSLPLRIVTKQLESLVNLKWLSRNVTADRDETFQPACDLSLITVSEVLAQIYNSGQGDLKIDHKKHGPQIEKFRRAAVQFGASTQNLLVKDL